MPDTCKSKLRITGSAFLLKIYNTCSNVTTGEITKRTRKSKVTDKDYITPEP